MLFRIHQLLVAWGPACGALFILAACSANAPEVPELPAGLKPRTVRLEGVPAARNLDISQFPRGEVALLVPEEFDTLMTWLDASDTPQGHRFKYRFTSSKGCLVKESGWMRPGTYCPDSFARLTLEAQQSSGPADSLEGVDKTIRAGDARNRAAGVVATVWKVKKQAVFHGRTFAVVESFGTGTFSAEPYEQLTAVTTLAQGNMYWDLTFRFECKQPDCRGFADQAYAVLRSARLR